MKRLELECHWAGTEGAAGASGGVDGIFETIANYTYDWEAWFDPCGRPRWVNPAVERITGWTRQECLAMPDFPLPMIHEADRAQMAELLVTAAAGSTGNDVEFRVLRKDGGLGWAAMSWQPIAAPDGTNLGFRTSIRDIAKRKRAEELLMLAKREAEQANKAKSQFLAAASHDLRQPLQAMSMCTATLQRMPLPEAAREVVEDIRRCLSACNDLLGGLLDVSRLDAGAVQPKSAVFAIGDVLETIEAEFRGQAAAKGLGFVVVQSSAFVETDMQLLSDILANLVSNAVRYTRTGRILVGCRLRGALVRLEVRDTGVGIAPAEIDRIFDEFYQIGNQARDRRKGLGLGLAIVRRLAALTGLAVGVHSLPGRGSTFWVEVPRASRDEGQAAAADRCVGADDLAIDGLCVAVIDDERAQLKAMEQFLAICGCSVIAAGSADELLERLAAHAGRIDALVVDFRLQDGLTGADAIARIRHRLGREIPALIVTGDTDPKRLADARASGSALLNKPVDPQALLSALSAAATTH